MHDFFSWSIFIAVAATLVILVIGVISMLRQGGFNERNSQKLMRLRVLLQFAAIVLLGLAFLFGR